MDNPDKKGPKRILCLDGGGIRGVLTLGFLQQIENLLRQRYNRGPEFRLCDYFDLISGTSTGSIIACLLALGYSASEIKKLYLEMGGKIFGQKRGFIKYFFRGAMYDHQPLEKYLRQHLGELTAHSDKVRTGLAIVTTRADTYSSWFITNIPSYTYYDRLNIKLWQLCRASSAAPNYFEPVAIEGIAKDRIFFIDGGVSSHNNPTLKTFNMVTLEGPGIQWETGEDQLLMVSIGTGFSRAYDPYRHKNLLDWAKAIPNIFMADADQTNQVLLQYLGKNLNPVWIDRAVREVDHDLLKGAALMTYVRYNTLIETESLEKLNLSFKINPEEMATMMHMDKAENRFMLAEIGEQDARERVNETHFPASFDLK